MPCVQMKKRRCFHTRSKRRLERGRRFYVRICRQFIALDRSGQKLQYCAERMIECGLLANRQLKNAKYSILRRIWKWDYLSKLSWHDWCEKNGWVSYYWTRRKIGE